jgi:sugar-phosphatase
MPIFAAAMLFDLDGVLADSTASVERNWSLWAERVGLEPGGVLARVHGRRAIDTIRELRPELDADAELATLAADEARDTEGVVAVAGARELTLALPAEAWAVVTSGVKEVALARLRAAGITAPRLMITGESIVNGKPDPEGYLLAARKLRVPADQCLVVEDAPAGAEASRRAGMRLLALTTTHPADQLAPADLIVPDLSHVALYLGGTGPRRLEIRA